MINKKLTYVSIFSFSWALKIFFNKLIKNKDEIKYLNIDIYKGLFFALSFLGMGYAIGLYGLKYSTSINYSFAIKSSIIFTPLLAILVLKEKTGKNRLFLIIAFIIGIYLILSAGNFILP